MKAWKNWTGKTVKSSWTEKLFIETKDSDWSHRLQAWKQSEREGNDCPCPMPQGHVMFMKGKK